MRIEIKGYEIDSRELCRKISLAFAKGEKVILEMTSHKANLEDVFIELTEDNGDTEETEETGEMEEAEETEETEETENAGEVTNGEEDSEE